ncbi:MAG: enoyl-CoA hydratase/isomerase family protein [Pseudomonadota bacterium]
MTEINVRVIGRVGRITLTRPEALNALTASMLEAIAAALTRWRDASDVAMVLIDGAGDRAFASGGDIVDLYETGKRGDYEFGRKFWASEYQLNLDIATYPKPFVALMHGFVMGGGVGVSAHGSHRIVTDSTRVAMPECGIGLVPDVGGSKILADAPGHVGEYLGTTGARMGPADAMFAGFADVFVPGERLFALIDTIEREGTPEVIADFIAPCAAAPLAATQAQIDEAFSAETIHEVVARLETMGTAWADKTLKELGAGCPLSIACAHEMIRTARPLTLREALKQEYRFIWRCMSEGEFIEGIRAAVIDKDRAPRWKRTTLAEIKSRHITSMLAPLENELQLSGGGK